MVNSNKECEVAKNFAIMSLMNELSGPLEITNAPLSKLESQHCDEELQKLLEGGGLFSRSVSYLEVELPKFNTSDDYQGVMYECGKLIYGKDNLRVFFGDIYLKLSNGRSRSGGKLGTIIELITVPKFLEKLKELEY